MERYYIFLLVIFFTISVLSAQSIEVCGDMKQGLQLETNKNLAEFIQANHPSTDICLMIAADGTALTIDYSVFPFIELIEQNNIWVARTEKAPPVCNLNNVVEIVLHAPLISEQFKIDGPCKSPFALELAKYKYLSKSYKNNLLARKYKLID